MKKKIILFSILFFLLSGLSAGIFLYDAIKLKYYSYKSDNKKVYNSPLDMQESNIEENESNNDNNYMTYNNSNNNDEEEYEYYEDEEDSGNTYYDPYYDPSFEYIDFEFLEEKELIDSLELAIQYAVDNSYGVNHSFIFSTAHSGFMHATKEKFIYDDVKEEKIVVSTIVPLEERYISVMIYPEGEGSTTYVSAVKYLSLNRMNIDFKELYQNYKSIIHKVVSKDIYQENYAHIVNRLIAAYTDLEGEEDKYEAVRKIMENHWGGKIESERDRQLWDVYEDLEEKVISPEILKIHESNFNKRESKYSNNSFLVWSYSFWLRRNIEGKADEVYNTLCNIRDDYNKLEV